jgi:hypothetical protein
LEARHGHPARRPGRQHRNHSRPCLAAASPDSGHPEYPSAHGCLTGAFTDALAAALHTADLDVTVPGATDGGTALTTSRQFATVSDIQRQIADARVWIGFHLRSSVDAGLALGNDVAGWALTRYFGVSYTG